MPKIALNNSQTMTMGAKADAILDVPRGWMRNSSTRMPQEIPTIAGVPIDGLTTEMPWIAPRTDCAGVRTPSESTRLTPKTPMTLSIALTKQLRSIPERRVRLDEPISEDRCRSNLTMLSSLGSRFTILAWIDS